MRGSFHNGVGTFYANDDTEDGKPVRTRLLWSEITPTSAVTGSRQNHPMVEKHGKRIG